ncbi:alpha/beta fold hydrolase [Oleomonas cavernae]|uniref:Alpha/beta fold hydrolase n=1 Tax=Oleomonas cavernae TaxID=2320859 RepID=A0A418WHK3_9PROT|nr:alpha/beta hydrolase [Oleomonas cavernae]RJF89379.1 alpha/beta fold hydrolase [Oleomonas cavernae]
MINTPEIARSIQTGAFATNCHDLGQGNPVVLIHGSGPGVTGWANWRLVMPDLAKRARVLAPDMVGFGYTDRPNGIVYSRATWIRQLLDLIDTLDLAKVDIVGNSFGGAIALAFAIQYPDRVGKLVLMGSAGLTFPVTDGLAAVWGYQPSLEAMRGLLDIFAYDRSLVTDELAELRYQASIRPGFQESFAAMFPRPHQPWLDALGSDPADIAQVGHDTLIVHGRDDLVVPLDVSLRLHHLLSRSQLHVFGRCGHWAQIEHAARFNRLVGDFLAD